MTEPHHAHLAEMRESIIAAPMRNITAHSLALMFVTLDREIERAAPARDATAELLREIRKAARRG